MKNKVIVWGVLLLMMPWPLFGAPLKIAVLGDSPPARDLADLFLAESTGKYELVERQEIETLLREIRLTERYGRERLARRFRDAGADLFGLIEKTPRGFRLTVLESSCGFRLSRTELAAEPATAVPAIAAQLDRANDQLRKGVEQLRMLSLAAVRNNLHSSLQEAGRRAAERAADLVLSGDMILLERDYLIELFRERQLSGKWEHPLSCSEIVHIELNPGSDARTFRIHVYFTRADDSISFRREFAPDDEAAWKELYPAVAEHLKQPVEAGRFDRKSEAARFFREAALADRAGDRDGALKKYFAAFALDPENTRYLSSVCARYDNRVDRAYPYVRTVLDTLMEQPALLDSLNVRQYLNAMLKLLLQQQRELSPATRKLHREWLEAHREEWFSRAAPDASAPARAIDRFAAVQPQWFTHDREFVVEKERSWEQLLTMLESAASALPEGLAEEDFHRLLADRLYRETEEIFLLQDRLPRSRLQEWTRTNADRLRNDRIPELRPLAPLLQANALLYHRDYTDDKALALYREYLRLCRESRTLPPPQCRFYSTKAEKFSKLHTALQGMSRTGLKDASISTHKPPPSPVPIPTSASSRPIVPAPVPVAKQKQQEQQFPVFATCPMPDGAGQAELTCDDFDYLVQAVSPTGERTTIATTPLLQNGGPAMARDWRLLVQPDLVLIVAPFAVFVGPGNGRELTMIDRLPLRVIAATAAGGRIWLAGTQELFSCKPDGSDRKMHFSAAQQELKLPQQQSGKDFAVAGLRSSPDGRTLLLDCIGPRGRKELLRYDPATGQTTPVSEKND